MTDTNFKLTSMGQMIVWAVAPASDPAMNLSCTLKLPPSLLPRISHLIWSRKSEEQEEGKPQAIKDFRRTQSGLLFFPHCKLIYSYYFFYHELSKHLREQKTQFHFLTVCPLTCSQAINLMADSGAIFRTLIPFPLQSESTPPSWIIPLRPNHRLISRAVEPCT